MKLLFLIFLFVIVLIPIQNIFANSEPILITQSSYMEDIIFDGKWTNLEWKHSSHNWFTYDENTSIHLRTAHQGDHIYVFVDPVHDLTLDKLNDEATICFDAKNEKHITYDENDYCFSVLLDSDTGNIFQGTKLDDSSSIMKEINNVEDFIAISSVSDEDDRYSKIPHPSYEFKIPIELFERSDNYGFYLSVYDASLEKFYSWPYNATRENSQIPSPSTWGDMISPDKSLPEMNIPIMIFVILLITIIVIQFKTKLPLFKTKI